MTYFFVAVTLWLAMIIIGIQAAMELIKMLLDFVKDRINNRTTN